MRWIALSKLVYAFHTLWTVLTVSSFCFVGVVVLLPFLNVAPALFSGACWYAVGILFLNPVSRMVFGGCCLTQLEVYLKRKVDPNATYDRSFFSHCLKRFLAIDIPSWGFRHQFIAYTLIAVLFFLRQSL